MFQNVIFDLDGTLLNTIDDLADAANWVCARHGWPLHTVEEYKRFVGNGIPRLVERFAPAPERTPEGLARALEEFSERYGAHRADKTAPYAGMPEAVERLRAAGVRTAVLSNKAHALAGPVVEDYYPPAHQAGPHPAAPADGADGGLPGGYSVRGGQRCGHPHRQERRPDQLRRAVGLPRTGGAGGGGGRLSGPDAGGAGKGGAGRWLRLF